MKDRIVRAVSNAGGIRVLTCSCSDLAREITALQGASPGVSVALGRGLAAGALMGALLKHGQRVALKFEANGPMQKLIVEADHDGAVRATVAHPNAGVASGTGGWDIPGLLGRAGFLTVSKDLGLGGEPYHGTVQLRTSEIGDDLAYYLTESEQVPSAVGVGVVLDPEGSIAGCGGFLVQALPKAVNTEIEQLMANIGLLPPLTSLLNEGGPELLLERVLGSVPHTVLETKEPFFRCGCSLEKVERALVSLGRGELLQIAASEGKTDVTCEFCRRTYHITAGELERLASLAAPVDGR